jgi:hypothetical protein
MEESHFKILTFLSKQANPICENNFPPIVTSEYSHNSADKGGLIYDLKVNLLTTKRWIEVTKYHPNFYIISNFGRTVLLNEIEKRKIESEKEELQKRKLKVDLVNAERTLKTYPSTRFMAISAWVVSICLLFLKLAELLSIWPYNK